MISRCPYRMGAPRSFFFFKQKTAYEIGLGIPAEPLFRSTVFPEIVPSIGNSFINTMKNINHTRSSISDDMRNILCSSANMRRAIPLILRLLMNEVNLSTNLASHFFDLVIGKILTSRLSLSKHLAHNLGNLLLLGKIGVFHNRRNASHRLLLLISKHLILCIYLVFRILA